MQHLVYRGLSVFYFCETCSILYRLVEVSVLLLIINVHRFADTLIAMLFTDECTALISKVFLHAVE